MDAVRAGGKPNVTEIGPFSYKETREKMNILSIHETISYGSYIDYQFDPETSCDICTNETEVTVINPVIVMVPYLVDQVEYRFSDSYILLIPSKGS